MKIQYKNRNFYTEELATGLYALYSYNTLVGYRYLDKVFFTTAKYSITTSKQCTQYTYENGLKRINITQHDLECIDSRTFLYNKIDDLNFLATRDAYKVVNV